MRDRLFAYIAMLLIFVLVAACGGGENEGEPSVNRDPTSRSIAEATTQATATELSNENASPSAVATLIIATAPNNEPIEKDQPTGSVPTPAASGEQPSVPSSFDADGDGFYTFEELEQAVAARYPSYEWPDNYQIDPDTLLSGFAGSAERGDRFEARAEYSIIGSRHLCAWQMAWLDAYREANTVLMDQSLDQLQRVALDNPMIDADTRDYLEQMFQRAELGDPALMQQYVDGNCGWIEFVSPAPATPPAET